MKKTILCLLLALGLLLMSAAAMAESDPSNNSFSIDDGSITIKDGTTPGTIMVQYGNDEKKDNIDPKTIIEIVGGGRPPQYNSRLSIETQVPVKIRYRVQFPETDFSYPMSIAANADVTLELNIESADIFRTGDQPAITLGSGSKLTVKGALENPHEELHLFSSQSAISGPIDSETPATVILNSGTVFILDSSGSAISGNVNLVINGGTFKAIGKDINVKNLIVTGGELWAGDNDSTKVTLSNLNDYSNITCTAGILHSSEVSYDYLTFFGNLTLPVDLTITESSNFAPDAKLTIPTGRSMTFSQNLSVHGANKITNNGTLTINESLAFYGELVNNGTLYINSYVVMSNGRETGTLTNTGTISGSGYIVPRLNQNPPDSLTVKSIENGAVTTVTLEADGEGKTALEYSADGTNWQESPTFTGVDLSAGRTFSARYKADGKFYQASAPAGVSIYPITLHLTADSSNMDYYIAGQGATLPTDVTRTGYTFAGWYDNAALTGNKVIKIDAEASGAKEYWANWTAKQYNVKLNTNGGTIVGEGLTSYTYGEGAMLPDDVERTGYTFAGWYDNAALAGSPVTAIGTDETDDREFWAGWIAAPVITSPAEDTTVTVYEGEQATMTIAAKNAAAYQWTMSTDGGASWTECGTDSPTYTTSPTKLENNGYQYMCVVTGLNELDKEELPPKEEIPPEGAGMSLRSRSRSTDDGLPDNAPATESPIFTLEVIRKDAIPQTGDSSHLTLWLALLGGSAACVAACCRSRKSARNK